MDRRGLLRWGLGLGLATGVPVLLGTSGCSAGDTRNPPPGGLADRGTAPNASGPQPVPDPSATPTFAGSLEAAEAERRVAGLSAAVLGGPWQKALGGRADLFAAVRDFHLVHATALAGGLPTARPTENSARPIKPSTKDTSLDSAIRRLLTAEGALATRHRLPALEETGGGALLWASLSLAASTYASALAGTGPVPSRKPKPPKPLPQLSDVRAMQQLVQQLHAVNYGYLLAIGRMSDGSPRNAAIRQLRSWRQLRDSLIANLSTLRVEIPVAEPAYAPTAFPRTDAGARRLLLDIETRLAPFVGLWLTAAPTVPERTRAFASLSSTVTAALGWGGPVRAWPGWP